MGTSTDAILFWGFTYEEGEIEPDLRTFGRFGKVYDETGCFVDNHQSDSAPVYYVGLKDAHVKARRGYPQEIKSLDVDPAWELRLRAFCERASLPWKEPKWFLVSYWGV